MKKHFRPLDESTKKVAKNLEEKIARMPDSEDFTGEIEKLYQEFDLGESFTFHYKDFTRCATDTFNDFIKVVNDNYDGEIIVGKTFANKKGIWPDHWPFNWLKKRIPNVFQPWKLQSYNIAFEINDGRSPEKIYNGYFEFVNDLHQGKIFISQFTDKISLIEKDRYDILYSNLREHYK